MLVAILIPQVILFGPSIVGRKILLPLDLLALDDNYLPSTPAYRSVVPQDVALSDLVLELEPWRRFAAEEVRAGRLPLWTPDYFAGAPFAVWPKYSPFNLIHYAFPFPTTLAWIQLAKALVAGLGAYLFFRRILGVGFWPATTGACCYPLTGFFMLWQGFLTSLVTPWFPWMLAATHSAVRRPLGWGGPALAALTALVAISGQADTAGHVLLASGLYALWCLIDEYGSDPWSGRALGGLAAAASAWALGLALSAPHLLPLLEYTQTGARMTRRAGGLEERPPIGLAALPQTVLPEMYGSTRRGSYLIQDVNLPESAAATYTGLLATLLVAPLAWCSRRHRSINVFWMLLAFVALAWQLDVPGVVTVLRLPGLNMLSHNRFVFVASFAVLAMAVVGLDVIWRRGPERRAWFLLPAGITAGLAVFCLHRAFQLPEPIASQLALAVREGRAPWGVPDLPAVWQIQQTFARSAVQGAAFCALAVAGWLALAMRIQRTGWFAPLLGILLAADLVWFARNLNPQTDPALYYPRLPVLTRLAAAPPGRVMGVGCLPANVLATHGLRDVRGYDGVDPKRLLDVLKLASDKRFDSPRYASTQRYVPTLAVKPSGEVTLPGVLNMLNLRYLVFRGAPPSTVVPLVQDEDYWAIENHGALPRVYVPRDVETVPDEGRMLERLGAADFDPRRVAYVDHPIALPPDADGQGQVVSEVPTRVTVSVQMRTPGLVVMADLWDRGWRAELDGRPVPILRANHVLRGVEVPKGSATLVFRYEPASFVWGLRLLLGALVGLVGWAGLVGLFPLRPRRRACYGHPENLSVPSRVDTASPT